MTVISEETLLRLLRTGLELSNQALALLESEDARDPIPTSLLEKYADFLRTIHDQKGNDVRLADESWEWIWQAKEDMNPIQLYGRLAWLNYRLIDLL